MSNSGAGKWCLWFVESYFFSFWDIYFKKLINMQRELVNMQRVFYYLCLYKTIGDDAIISESSSA